MFQQGRRPRGLGQQQGFFWLGQRRRRSKATKHIARRELIVREREVEGELVVAKVDTKSNLADMFTKVLDRVPFEHLRRQVMNVFVRT